MNEDGTVAVIERSTTSRKIVIFDRSRTITKAMEVKSAIQDLAFAGSDLYGLIDDKVVRLSDNTVIASLDAHQKYMLVSRGASTFAAVSSTSPEVYGLNASGGTWAPHILSDPELSKRIAERTSRSVVVTNLLIYSATCDTSGMIYGALSPYPLDHAVIIQFNSSGRVFRSLNLQLPVAPTIRRSERMFAKTPAVTNLSALFIAVSPDGNRLCSYSQPHNQIAVYDISQHSHH
jgi:hypothetical protein